MIWTLTDGDTIFPISDGWSRIYKIVGEMNVNLRQSTQMAPPMRSEWPVAYPGRARRTLSFDLTVTFPPCSSFAAAEMQALDIPAQCPRGGELKGVNGSLQRTYAQAWIDAVRPKNLGVRNEFTFSVTAVNPSTQTLSTLAQMDIRSVANLYAITGLTGGGATNLDGLVTADVLPGFQVQIFVPVSGLNQLAVFRLFSGTDATNTDPTAGPLIVRPVDYDAGTNAKVWKRLDA